MRNDGWTRCIDATLYIKELLATPVAAVVSDLACEDKRAGCERAGPSGLGCDFHIGGYVMMRSRAAADGPHEVV